MKITKNKLFLFIILVLPLIFFSLNCCIPKSGFFDSNSAEEIPPNSSGYWELTYIHIDNNWSESASTYDWCSGLGTQISPYLIENVRIDGNSIHDCLLIENSDDFFLINNCTFLNSSNIMMPQSEAGIKLNNVSNGILLGNNCSLDNYFGINCYDCENIQIINNIANDNGMGIALNKSRNCIISDNTANSATAYGISLIESANNQVTNNKALYNHFFGIVCIMNSRNNTIYHNNASLNEGYGFIIDLDAHNNTVSENYANFNYQMGIAVGRSNDSIIRGNIMENNMYGIILTNASQNLVSENYIFNNSYYGIYLMEAYGPCDNNLFFGNDLINNTEAGLYIDKPLHTNNLFNENEFLTNGLHVFDNGTDTQWDDGNAGNYWDNYTGMDSDDDGIGDTPHVIQQNPSRQDNFPLWDDGDDIPPIITVIYPSNGTIFNATVPILNLMIYDFHTVDQAWYIFNGMEMKYFFIPSIGINAVPLNQSAWDLLSEGNITVSIFINDSAGHLSNINASVIKKLPEQVTTSIPFGYFFLIVVMIGIISLVIKTNWKKIS